MGLLEPPELPDLWPDLPHDLPPGLGLTPRSASPVVADTPLVADGPVIADNGQRIIFDRIDSEEEAETEHDHENDEAGD